MKYQTTLVEWIQQDVNLMCQLGKVEQLGIDHCCIGAGAIRNLVWDRLHNYSERTPLNDVDVVYFDNTNLTKQQEHNYQQALTYLDPTTPWEVVNQARVHMWYQPTVPPLKSLAQGISTWPETATCVGAFLEQGKIQLIAPHGLDDLFELKLVHNPARIGLIDFLARQEKKRFQLTWPKLAYMPAKRALAKDAI
jgi:hypothetical protein